MGDTGGNVARFAHRHQCCRKTKRPAAHSGVDWQGAAAAAWGNLWNTRTRGASTLTMQLAGLLDEDPRRPTAAGQGAQRDAEAGTSCRRRIARA
ncbi:transglycosylase domain-containing protein [Cupriavidus basilensis]